MAPKYLADHCAGECLFPVGDPPASGDMSRQLFCCRPVKRIRVRDRYRQRYCAAHNRIAYPASAG